jgi:hypothetical protein
VYLGPPSSFVGLVRPLVQVIDCKKYGPATQRCDDLLNISAHYLVLRQYGSLSGVPRSTFQESHEKHLIWAFKLRFPRDEASAVLLCD